jgi:repressor LexA
MEKNERASKKQRELLIFIDGFIKGNNYGPSYREIMRALGYRSVSTVATHVDGLIARGYLRKEDNSARSIQVVSLATAPPNHIHEQWLVTRIEQKIQAGVSDDDKAVLESALKILDIKPENHK